MANGWLCIMIPLIVGISAISIPLIFFSQSGLNAMDYGALTTTANNPNSILEVSSDMNNNDASGAARGALEVSAYPEWALGELIQNESQLQMYHFVKVNDSQVNQAPVLKNLIEQAYQNREITPCGTYFGCNRAISTAGINQSELDAIVKALGKSNLEKLDVEFQGVLSVGIVYQNYVYNILIQPGTVDFSDFVLPSTIVYLGSEKYRLTGTALSAYSDFENYDFPLFTIATQSKYLLEGDKFALVIEGSPQSVNYLATKYKLTELTRKESNPSSGANVKAYLSFYGTLSKDNLLKLLDEITSDYLKSNELTIGALGGVTTDDVHIDARNAEIEAHAAQISDELDLYRHEKLASIIAQYPEDAIKL